MLLNALLTADFESAVVLTESAAFLNSDTQPSLQNIAIQVSSHQDIECLRSNSVNATEQQMR